MRGRVVQYSKKVLTLLLIAFLAMNNGIIVDASTITETDLLLINLDEDKNMAMRNNEIVNGLSQSGQTIVVYGSNLDVEAVNQTYFPEGTLVLNPADDEGSVYQTYAIVGTNTAGKIRLSYYTLCHPVGMEMDSIWEEVLSEESITNIALEFAREKQEETLKRGVIVDDVVDNASYYDTYYPTGMTSSFSMKMYERSVTYQVVKVNDTIADYDYYYVTAYVSITPGNNITQTYPAYKNALVVIGAQTDITRGKSTDSFIDVVPNHSSVETLIQNKNYSYSLSVGADGMLSIGFSWTPSNKVTRETSLSSSNFINFYGGQDLAKKWCISTNTFTYKLGAYIRSYGSNFSCKVDTSVKTLFQNQGISDAKWSENPLYLSYSVR